MPVLTYGPGDGLLERAKDPKKPYGDVKYADPGYQADGKKRYPIDTKQHVQAAWSYINQSKNAGQYSSDQVSKIKGRIQAAAKKFGIEIQANMDTLTETRTNPWENADEPPVQGVDEAVARINVREPDMYTETNGRSFFVDLAKSTVHRDLQATDRLQRHQAYEERVNPNTTAGTGGEFAPPGWFIDKFQTVARTGRVCGDLVTNLVLPRGISSVNIPKMTTGTATGIQPGQGNPATQADEVTTNSGSSTNVVTISGNEFVSQQLFDLTPSPPGYDGIVYRDLCLDYNQTLELQMLAGTGSNGQLTGMTKVSGIGSVSGAGVSQTQNTSVQNLWPLIGQAAAIIGTQRQLPAEYVLMSPRRYYSIASALDGSQRPLGTIGNAPHPEDMPLAGGGRAVDRVIGIPCYLTGGIIQAASSSADYILVVRMSDMLLYESTPHFACTVNDVAGTLQVGCHLRRYVAFLNFKPSSISVVTSIPQPTNF